MNRRKLIPIISLMCILCMALPITALADFGPKPQLTITVTNPPKDKYYLDLLVEQDTGFTCTDVNLSQQDLANADPDMLKMLRTGWALDGWYPALAGGATVAPMWGSLMGSPDTAGEKPADPNAPGAPAANAPQTPAATPPAAVNPANPAAAAQTQLLGGTAGGEVFNAADKYVHSFYYTGVPDTYRIVIVTETGDTRVSPTLTRDLLQENMTYDYRTGALSKNPIAIAYLLQFLSTLIPTLLIEGLILMLFKFSLKENGKIFFLVNFLTQVALTVVVGNALIHKGTPEAMMLQLPVELIILAVETVLYLLLLKGQPRPKRVIYAVVANVASAGAGLALMGTVFSLIMRF